MDTTFQHNVQTGQLITDRLTPNGAPEPRAYEVWHKSKFMVRYHEKELKAAKAHAEMIGGYVITVNPEQLNNERLARREQGRLGNFSVDDSVFIGANLRNILPLPSKPPTCRCYKTTMSWTTPGLSSKKKQSGYLATLRARRNQYEAL